MGLPLGPIFPELVQLPGPWKVLVYSTLLLLAEAKNSEIFWD